nr:far upstream element-binding protein 1 [Ipomoea batatas]
MPPRASADTTSSTDAATEIASFPSFEGHIGETKVPGMKKFSSHLQVIPLHFPPGDTSTERTVQIDESSDQIEHAKQLISEHACILCILLDFMWKSKAVLKLCEANKGVYVKAGQLVAAVRVREVPKEYSLLFQCLQS